MAGFFTANRMMDTRQKSLSNMAGIFNFCCPDCGQTLKMRPLLKTMKPKGSIETMRCDSCPSELVLRMSSANRWLGFVFLAAPALLIAALCGLVLTTEVPVLSQFHEGRARWEPTLLGLLVIFALFVRPALWVVSRLGPRMLAHVEVAVPASGSNDHASS